MKWALVLVMLASCDRFIHRSVPDAGELPTTITTTTTTTTSTAVTVPEPNASGLFGLHIPGEEEEEPLVADAGPCPLAIHPYYCRRRCRGFAERSSSLHARRIGNPTRAGTGKCGAFKVFGEDDATGGIVEYFDDTNQLIGVSDSRQKPCGTYGDVPKCKLEIQWGPPRGGGLGSIRK
jgi:hypothetical protein